MQDEQIIGLFFDRSEAALEEMKTKYGQRAKNLADNLLQNSQDAEECVNDAMLTLWDQIPPARPKFLWAYFSRVLRNICCDRLDHLCAAKRDRGSEVCLAELESCFSSREDPSQMLESGEITRVINAFLAEQDATSRRIFVRRYYYYFDSCADISKMVGLSRGAVNTRLSRLRTQLRQVLEKEEIFL